MVFTVFVGMACFFKGNRKTIWFILFYSKFSLNSYIFITLERLERH